jgi:hypothetical protein
MTEQNEQYQREKIINVAKRHDLDISFFEICPETPLYQMKKILKGMLFLSKKHNFTKSPFLVLHNKVDLYKK